jgi:hypothetical protein
MIELQLLRHTRDTASSNEDGNMSYRLMRKSKICMELNVKTSAVGVNLMRHTFVGGARDKKCHVSSHFCLSFINEAILFNYPV